MSAFRGGRWGARDPAAVGRLEARAAVARLLLLAGTAVALVLVAGIVLVFLDANRGTDIWAAGFGVRFGPLWTPSPTADVCVGVGGDGGLQDFLRSHPAWSTS